LITHALKERNTYMYKKKFRNGGLIPWVSSPGARVPSRDALESKTRTNVFPHAFFLICSLFSTRNAHLYLSLCVYKVEKSNDTTRARVLMNISERKRARKRSIEIFPEKQLTEWKRISRTVSTPAVVVVVVKRRKMMPMRRCC